MIFLTIITIPLILTYVKYKIYDNKNASDADVLVKLTNNIKTDGLISYPDTELSMISINQLSDIKLVNHNDVHYKFIATYKTPVSIYIISDNEKAPEKHSILIDETYQQYQDTLKYHDWNKEKWIYDIIDNNAETDTFLYQDEDIIILPNYTWNKVDISILHLLVIFKDKSLKTIRHLTYEHLDMLKRVREKSLEITINNFPVNTNILRFYFHYAPTTYQLHMHITPLTHKHANTSIEYCHTLTSIIENLSLIPDYYQRVIITKRSI